VAKTTAHPTTDAGERLQKLLSAAGVASRRHAEELITGGRVAVNGRVVRELGTRADPARDVVTVDGERLVIATARRTIALHKPRGVVSTMSDPEGRATVRDLVREVGERLYPIGRLDLQTTGLLLLTNDGALAARLLAAEREVPRVYHAKVDGRVSSASLERLRRGVRIGPGTPVAARVAVLHALPTKTWLEVEVRHGQWHVVRRLCEAIGHRVDKLVRVRFGPIELGRLPLGAWRDLGPAELRALREAAGLSPGGAAGAGAPSHAPRPRTPPRRGGSRSRGARRSEASAPRAGRGR
jgi:23S rRNA pseudouridine2605 synthase